MAAGTHLVVERTINPTRNWQHSQEKISIFRPSLELLDLLEHLKEIAKTSFFVSIFDLDSVKCRRSQLRDGRKTRAKSQIHELHDVFL